MVVRHRSHAILVVRRPRTESHRFGAMRRIEEPVLDTEEAGEGERAQWASSRGSTDFVR